MSVRLSLLAIVNQGPCYGYQLRAEFDRRTGSTWPINVGQIYSTLDRLERDGLVEKPNHDSEGQNFYEITSSGTAEVAEWFGSPTSRPGTSRDELAVKLAIAITLPGVDVTRVIDVQQTSTRANLAELVDERDAAQQPRSSEQLAVLLARDSAIYAAEAELRWLEHVADRMREATAKGIADPLPLSTAIPKRGRPPRTSDS